MLLVGDMTEYVPGGEVAFDTIAVGLDFGKGEEFLSDARWFV